MFTPALLWLSGESTHGLTLREGGASGDAPEVSGDTASMVVSSNAALFVMGEKSNRTFMR